MTSAATPLSESHSPWLRWRVPLGFIFGFGYLFLTRHPDLRALKVCAVLVFLGCLLRSWAAGYLFKGKRVAVGGPYAYVRNPLYLGSFLIGLGFCAALWHDPLPLGVLVFWGVFAVGFLGVYPAKSKAEEKELLKNLGEPYRAYAEKVPAFLPLCGRTSGLGEQHFSSELFRRNREYECWIGSAAVLLILVVQYCRGL